MYINKTIENYIRLHREDKDHIDSTTHILLEAMMGLYYARLNSDGDEKTLNYLQSTEHAVTELYFLIENIKDEGEEKK